MGVRLNWWLRWSVYFIMGWITSHSVGVLAWQQDVQDYNLLHFSLPFPILDSDPSSKLGPEKIETSKSWMHHGFNPIPASSRRARLISSSETLLLIRRFVVTPKYTLQSVCSLPSRNLAQKGMELGTKDVSSTANSLGLVLIIYWWSVG